MKKGLYFSIGLFTFLIIAVLSSRHASAEVIGAESVINGLITQQQINQTQKPQYYDRSGMSEMIDPVTGNLSLKFDQIRLPGREGLDLNIGVMYQSNYSFNYMRYYGAPSNLKKYNYLNSRYDLGIGWSFRFPSVQLQDGYIYYHSGEGAIYRVDFNATGSAESYTHLLGYQGKDLKFVLDAGSFSNGQATSSYFLEYANKKREYFAADGRLLGIVDRFGNKITFTHADREMFDGQTYKVITLITDTVGRTISFDYETNLQSEDFNGEKIVVTVKDPSGNFVQNITYTKWRANDILNGNPDGHTPYLWKIENQVGEYIYFNYLFNIRKYDYSSKYINSNTGNDINILLNTAKFRGSQTTYQFDKVTRNLGTSGVGEEFRVTSRKDQLWKFDYNQSTWNLSGDYNHVNYTYSGDYSGFPNYYDQNNLPSSYTYSSTATVQSMTKTNGMATISVFNGLQQPVSNETRAANGERKVSTYTSFHPTYKYLTTSTQLADYAVGDTDITANKLFIDKQYTDWGGLQSETQPLTQSQLSDVEIKNKHTTTYVYEPNYYQIQSKTWYQNLSDTIPLMESFAYDNNGRAITFTNAKGEVTNTCYDIADAGGTVYSNCSGGTTPLLGKVQKVTTTKNLGNGKTSKAVTIFSPETNYAYPSETNTYFSTTDGNGQPITQIVNKMMTYYIGSGLLKDEIDGNNNKTTYTYDELGRVTEVKYPTLTNLNGVQYDQADVFAYNYNYVSTNYDSVNSGTSSLLIHSYRKYTEKTSGTVRKLNDTYNYYDGFGNLIFQDSPGNGWKFTQYHYDDQSRAIYEIDPMQNVTNASYDEWGLLNEVTDAYGNLYVTENNLKARRTINYIVAASDVNAFRTDPNQVNLKKNYIEQDHDQWGQVVQNRAYKDSNHTQSITELYTYNILGQVVTYIDPKNNLNNEGVTKKFGYDSLNRLVTVKDALSQLTKYQYDLTGNIQQISMQRSETDTPVIIKSKQYNEIGGIVQNTDSSNLSEVYSYNNLGLLNKQVDRNETVFTNQYDQQNRITVSSASNNGETQSNKLIIGSNGIMYDTAETYLNGTKIGSMNTGMDSLKRLTSITMSATNYSSSIGLQYDNNSRVTQQANNLSLHYVNYKYDKQRLSQVQMDGQSTLNSANSANASYEYYPNGLLKSITYPTLTNGTVLQTIFEYDSLNRQKTVSNMKGTSILSKYSYEYDNNGNITSKTETVNQVPQTFGYTYDALNRLLTITRPGGTSATYTYDLMGNRETLQDSGAIKVLTETSYTYDLLNRLMSVTSSSGTSSFSYAPNNLRYKKTAPTGTIQYQYNSLGQVISESDDSNMVKANYIRGDRLLAKEDVASDKVYYYLYNGHGDVVQIIDTNGTIVNEYQYDEWGNITYQTETIPNSFKYAGEQYDEETGLYYLRARYYDPSVGRFINEDSYEGQINNPLSLNLYAYVQNNPLIYSDPSGHYCVSADGKYSHAGACVGDLKGDKSNSVYLGDDKDWKGAYELYNKKVTGLVGNKQSKGYYKDHDVVVASLDVERLKSRSSQYIETSSNETGDIVTFSGKIGGGAGFHIKTPIINGTAEIMINDYCDSSGECGVENSNGLQINFFKKAGVGAEANATIDAYGNRKEQYFVGAYFGDYKIGQGDLVESKDWLVSIGLGVYVGAGGEFELTINMTKLYNHLNKWRLE